MTTRSGHNFFEMASALQKGIRRGDFNLAGYAAHELIEKYRKYLWKRLLIISAEDCYGIMTKEIVALEQADGATGGKDAIFVAKAIMLLCMALKNRDACYFACNLMTGDHTIDPADIEHIELGDCELTDGRLPDYVYDCHTSRGKRMGRTVRDMIKAEQEALQPKQINFFDNEDWAPYLTEQGLSPLDKKKGE